ncbi:MAG: ABC transporter ATP-binding protein [Gemmatimonadetes bacterium]|nr:ABC transporter ATP-binding protein [Gemmatimonadota bacterium]
MNELRTVLPYVRPYRRGIAAGLALVAASNIGVLLSPALLGLAIDAMRRPGATLGAIASYAGLIVLATVVGGAARYGMRQLLNAISRRVETDLRDAFFAHLMRLDAGFYGRTRTGDLMSRATNDTQAVRMAIGPGIMYLVNTIVSTVFSLLWMLRYSVPLTLLALIPMVLLPVVMRYFGTLIHQRFSQIQDHFGVITTMVQENLSGVRIVRAYVQEEAQERELDLLNREYVARNMALARLSAVFNPLLSILTGTGLLITLWYGGRQTMTGALTVGDFVGFSMYLGMLTWPLIALGRVVNLFQRGAASMARINRIMETESRVVDAPQATPLPTVRGEIEFRDVAFRYPGTERDVLRDLSFRIPAGSTSALVGRTGSGKSTLLALLTRRFDPDSGQILLAGGPLPLVPLAQLRQVMGVVPQEAFVFSESIAANIAFGMEQHEDGAHRVRRAADVAQLTDTVSAFPDGFDTRLGERGVNLSGGQRQRATLARALARDPRIVVLDDALSAVDTHTEKEILRGLHQELEGRTAIVVSHRVSAVMNADQILVLEDGRLVAQGTHAELVTAGGLYATLLRRQLLEEGLDGDALVADAAES